MPSRPSPVFSSLVVTLLALSAGCADREPSRDPSAGPVLTSVERAALDAKVPRDVLLAIAHIEGGLKLRALRDVREDDEVPVAGALELRHGGYDSLRAGARLVASTEADLVRDHALATIAGARVLAELGSILGGIASDLASWSAAIEVLSGHRDPHDRADYRARVFRLLREGGEVAARDGERIRIAPHPELPVSLTITPPGSRIQGTPEFPGAIWFDTPEANKWTPGRTESVTMIAIHDTEGGWDASVSTLQNDGGKSVHYIIDADGSRVGQFISESDTAWHAGNWFYNQRMVGIEHVGFWSDDNYQTALYEKSGELVRAIAARWGMGPQGDGTHLDRSVLVGHQEIPNGNTIAESSPPCPDSPSSCVADDNYGGAGNHRDPGVYWEWCQYMQIVGQGATCKCDDAYSLYNCVHDGSAMVRCADGSTIDYVACEGGCNVQPVGVPDACVNIATGGSAGSSGAAGDAGASGAAGASGSAGSAGTSGASGSAASGSSGSSGNSGSSGTSGSIGGAGGECQGNCATVVTIDNSQDQSSGCSIVRAGSTSPNDDERDPSSWLVCATLTAMARAMRGRREGRRA